MGGNGGEACLGRGKAVGKLKGFLLAKKKIGNGGHGYWRGLGAAGTKWNFVPGGFHFLNQHGYPQLSTKCFPPPSLFTSWFAPLPFFQIALTSPLLPSTNASAAAARRRAGVSAPLRPALRRLRSDDRPPRRPGVPRRCQLPLPRRGVQPGRLRAGDDRALPRGLGLRGAMRGECVATTASPKLSNLVPQVFAFLHVYAGREVGGRDYLHGGCSHRWTLSCMPEIKLDGGVEGWRLAWWIAFTADNCFGAEISHPMIH